MSVTLSPSNALGFRRPLTSNVRRTLTINNTNSQPVAFKVKTTAPKLYCVRPNSGRIDPGAYVEVSVMLQGLKEEPPLNQKCKDKFLIQSTIITPEKETLPLNDLWNVADPSEEGKILHQKLRVFFLPPEGAHISEEDEGQVLSDGSPSRYDTVRPPPAPNGHTHLVPLFSEPGPAHEDVPLLHEPTTPPAVFSAARDMPPEEPEEPEPEPHMDRGLDLLNLADDVPPQTSTPLLVPTAPPEDAPQPSPLPVKIPLPEDSDTEPTPVPVPVPDAHTELAAQLNNALEEIKQLKAQLAARPDPTSSPSTADSEVRRKRSSKAFSDDGSTIAPTEVGTMYADDVYQPEGVPLQVVVIIALGVFITTYLFF